MHIRSELLALLNERAIYNQSGQHTPPTRTPVLLASVSAATGAWQEAWKSDPFAGARVRLYMLQGYELPSDVAKDAHGLNARRRLELLSTGGGSP